MHTPRRTVRRVRQLRAFAVPVVVAILSASCSRAPSRPPAPIDSGDWSPAEEFALDPGVNIVALPDGDLLNLRSTLLDRLVEELSDVRAGALQGPKGVSDLALVLGYTFRNAEPSSSSRAGGTSGTNVSSLVRRSAAGRGQCVSWTSGSAGSPRVCRRRSLPAAQTGDVSRNSSPLVARLGSARSRGAAALLSLEVHLVDIGEERYLGTYGRICEEEACSIDADTFFRSFATFLITLLAQRR